MTYTIGLDIGSTYTKGLILDHCGNIVSKSMSPSGIELEASTQNVMNDVINKAGLNQGDIAYCITTGFGRHQFAVRDTQVTDVTAVARGASFLFPGTRTILDIGGQTVKASRIDEHKKVKTFRLNDKCASGTGTFLEKTVRYMGFDTKDIDGLLKDASDAASISGVCTVFAESEVINHLSESVPPENIMLGAGLSLTGRSVQLLRRVKIENEVTLVGGILRWGRMVEAIAGEIDVHVNVPEGDLPQYTAALGCAVLGHVRLKTAEFPAGRPSFAKAS
ncbi:MAG: acyl-CoA dehydratase activase [Porticoccaceae bacterium]